MATERTTAKPPGSTASKRKRRSKATKAPLAPEAPPAPPAPAATAPATPPAPAIQTEEEPATKEEGPGSATPPVEPPTPAIQAPAKPPLIPGLELVGHGIMIRPRLPYEVKPLRLDQDKFDANDETSLFHSGSNQALYRVPEGYAVNTSAPPPSGRILGRTIVQESFEYLEKELTVDATAAASSGTIGFDINAGSVESLRSSEDSIYALHDFFIPLWTVYIKDVSAIDGAPLLKELPIKEYAELREELKGANTMLHSLMDAFGKTKTDNNLQSASADRLAEMTLFDLFGNLRAKVSETEDWGEQNLGRDLKHVVEDLEQRLGAYRLQLRRFFEKFGTHYVRRAWVGGSVRLALSVQRSAQISEEDIQQGIKASFQVLSGSASTEVKESQKKLASSATVAVTGQGGDVSLMANFTSLDLTSFPDWLESVKTNPEVIHLDVAGIWTLVNDLDHPGLAERLRSEYEFMMTFHPGLSAVWSQQSDIFFLRGETCTKYDRVTKKTITGSFKTLPGIRTWLQDSEGGSGNKKREREVRRRFRTIDAVLSFDNDEQSDPGHAGEIYFFKDHKYIVYDAIEEKVVEGPLLIQGSDPDTGAKLWPGMPFGHISAAVSWGDGKAYLFSGGRYVRYDIQQKMTDLGYPKAIQGNWPGVTFDQIDAVVAFGNGKIYFFREDQYIRFDMENFTADAGYPKYLSGGDVAGWKFE